MRQDVGTQLDPTLFAAFEEDMMESRWAAGPTDAAGGALIDDSRR